MDAALNYELIKMPCKIYRLLFCSVVEMDKTIYYQYLHLTRRSPRSRLLFWGPSRICLFHLYDGNLFFLLVKFNKQVKRILILEKSVTVRQKSTIRFFKARCTRKICFVCICTTLTEYTLPHKHILIVTSHRSQTLSEESISKFVDSKKEKDCNSPLRNNEEKDT